MKKILFLITVAAAMFFACNKDDSSNIKPVQLGQAFNLAMHETAELETDGMRITFMGITEDSRCPTTVNCVWAGRAVAEFKVVKGRETLIESLTDNPANDPALSTSFNAFGHGVRLLQVMPYPATSNSIDDKDYIVRLEIGDPIYGDTW